LQGDYTLTNAPIGTYYVQESQPVGYGSSSPNVLTVTLVASNATGINFADTLSSLGGLVYRDEDGSQSRNGAEPTMPAGITITLTGTDITGAPVTRTTATNASGTYVFEDLKQGNYTVSETQPTNFGNGAAHAGSTGGAGQSNSNVITAIPLPEGEDSVNNNFGDVPKNGAVSGSAWRDNDHDKIKDPGEPALVGWTVQLYREPIGGGTPTLVVSTLSDGNGAYSFTGQEVGPGYSIRFIAPGGAVFGGAVNGEAGVPIPGGSQVVRGELTNLTLQPSTTIPQQSLPVDPAGVVYDSDTRLPVPGAIVSFAPIGACPGYNPAIHFVGGAANANQVVGADGFYQFLLDPGAPACQYGITITPPAGYVVDPGVPPQPMPLTPPNRPPYDPFLIVPNANAPQLSDPTTWYQSFNLGPNSRDVVNNHLPLVSTNRPVLFISKVAGKSTVELGDNVKYTVKVRYVSGNTALPVLRVVDSMPAGFKLIPGTSFVSVPTGAPVVAVPAGNIIGAPGAVVTYNIPLPGGVFNIGQEMELTYRVRVGVGSMQGDGINRAQAASIGAVRSNIAQARVKVNPGVFTSDACIVGKIYVDCNNNHIQDAEEVGVPGVRMYLQDGTYMVSDSEGKYSICGLEPKSHVLKVDQITLPRGSRLTTTSNRNLGNADSLWLDLKNGEMQQADFAIGSCSNTVLEQVKARRAQGGVRSIDNERKDGGVLKFEGKSADYPDQGTDSANQPLVKPRPPGELPPQSDAENNIPVPQLPAASSNTLGNNIRQAK
jgi:large repetitive protein